MPKNLARLGVIAAILAATASIAPSAMAAPADDKELCKSGGFANYVDPTTDLPFKNQGRCVSFVNGGGVLVPVQEEPPVPVAPTVKTTVTDQYYPGTGGSSGASGYLVNAELQGQPNTTYALIVRDGRWAPESVAVVTNSDGLATFSRVTPAQGTFSVSYNGQVIGTATTPPAPVTPPTPPSPPVVTNPTVDVEPDPTDGNRVVVTGTGFAPNVRVAPVALFADGTRGGLGSSFSDAAGSIVFNGGFSLEGGYGCDKYPATFELIDTGTGVRVPGDETFTPAACL